MMKVQQNQRDLFWRQVFILSPHWRLVDRGEIEDVGVVVTHVVDNPADPAVSAGQGSPLLPHP